MLRMTFELGRRPAMSVYVGIDVHRKRSQVAVIDAKGEVLANRNVPNGVEPILKMIGGLPPGTPAAFEAAFGWGWLVELLEGYGFDPHLVHPPFRCDRRLVGDVVAAWTSADVRPWAVTVADVAVSSPRSTRLTLSEAYSKESLKKYRPMAALNDVR
jgi:hypothetical protein